MNIFAIADLHLSGQPPTKPMTPFGEHWLNHWDKIKNDWQNQVTDEDIVLLAGDTSWALKLTEALTDLEEIASLPGKKILIKGNHDYWWQTVKKMNAAMNNRLFFLHNTYSPAGEYAICGTRGWTCPEDPNFTAEDLSTYNRELIRLETSLSLAKSNGYQHIIVMLHYPPVVNHNTESDFIKLMKKYNVSICVYGHLHGESQNDAPIGNINGITCLLTACDATDFKLKKIV